jgi:K+/H+ antiporter YhaU regulatory subunit KhtT
LFELVAGRSVMDVEMDELVIPAGSPLVGFTVEQAEARRKHGLLIVAVKQAHGKMVFNPDADQAFAAGDILIVMGSAADAQRFRQQYGL